MKRLSLGVSTAWLGLVVAACLAAPWLTAYDPIQPIAAPLSTPSLHPPIGADDLGRDEWARMLFGGRLSLAASLTAAALAVALGTAAALVSQGLGGAADATVAGGANAALAIPSLLVALAIVAVLGPGIETVVVAVGLGLAPGFARLARQALIEVRAEPFVAAAVALGAGGMTTAFRHLLPNALPRLLSLATTHYAWAFAGITTLTFLGLAEGPSTPEWGSMLNASRAYLGLAPWLALYPAGAIAATVLAVHGVGAWLARRARGEASG